MTKFSLKIRGNGHLHYSNVYLMGNGKQLFELSCHSIEIEIKPCEPLRGIVVVSIYPGMEKDQVKILSSIVRHKIIVGNSRSKVIFDLPISDINLKGKIKDAN